VLSNVCYSRRMTHVASRELRNRTRDLLDRVASGETITITVDGRPVATLEAINRRPRWISRAEFTRRILATQADAELTADLRDLAGDLTDDQPLR
jgi:prevent-host-death family protein